MIHSQFICPHEPGIPPSPSVENSLVLKRSTDLLNNIIRLPRILLVHVYPCSIIVRFSTALPSSLYCHFIPSSLPVKLDMPTKRPKRDHRWSMYPSLHDSVSRLLEEANLPFEFHGIDDTENCTKEYDTNIMGQFICRNRACGSNGWTSKKIAIIIRMYLGGKYNARVYHQRCKSCDSLSRPSLDNSYAERVVYRLRKWSGIQMDLPLYFGKKKGPPHNSDLCEGCRDGHCNAFGSLWL